MDNVNVLRNGFLAPDFSLPDASGNVFTLRQKIKDTFTCLCFFPNGGKEKTTSLLKDLSQGLPSTASGLAVQIIGICPEDRNHLAQLKEKIKISFPILSDKDGDVTARYYMTENNAFRPTTYFGIFIIDDAGIIRHRAIEVPGSSKLNLADLRAIITRLI